MTQRICCKHAAFIDNILFSVDAEILTSTNRASVTYSFLAQSFILAFFHIGLINNVFTFEDGIHSGTDAAALVGDVLVRIKLDVFTSDTATKVIDVLTFKGSMICSRSGRMTAIRTKSWQVSRTSIDSKGSTYFT